MPTQGKHKERAAAALDPSAGGGRQDEPESRGAFVVTIAVRRDTSVTWLG